MTITDFLALIAKMRLAQKDYFKYRDKKALQLSMKLEREVDDIIKSKFYTDQPATNQLSIENFL